MQLSADGRYVAWPSQEDKRIKVWDARDECMVQHLDLGNWFVPKGFSPTHQLLVAVANSSHTGVDRTLFVNAALGRLSGGSCRPSHLR